MIAKRTGIPPIKTRRKIQTRKIAVKYLATMFELDDPHLGIIGAIVEDEHENVPAIFDGNSGQYVSLLTGEMSNLDVKSFALTTEVWYVPHSDTFDFITYKRLAKISRLDLIKVFGEDVIINVK